MVYQIGQYSTSKGNCLGLPVGQSWGGRGRGGCSTHQVTGQETRDQRQETRDKPGESHRGVIEQQTPHTLPGATCRETCPILYQNDKFGSQIRGKYTPKSKDYSKIEYMPRHTYRGVRSRIVHKDRSETGGQDRPSTPHALYATRSTIRQQLPL